MVLFFYAQNFIYSLPEHIAKHFNATLKKEGIAFKLSKPRSTKLGDYRYNRVKKTHTISVNNNLNPYAFAITFLHEVAHKIAFTNHGFRIAPHGVEWKLEFQKLLVELLSLDFFPENLKPTLFNFINNPKASSGSSHELTLALAQYDCNDTLRLQDINEGDYFTYSTKKYKKLKKRRTRSLCERVSDGKKYLILETAPIST